jgi:uncharacterized membrane protein YhdT
MKFNFSRFFDTLGELFALGVLVTACGLAITLGYWIFYTTGMLRPLVFIVIGWLVVATIVELITANK